jgi:excisionase family DNA binding protein
LSDLVSLQAAEFGSRPCLSELKARRLGMARRESMLRPVNEKLAFTIVEVAALSSLGQTSIYKAISEGRLRIRKYGTRTIVTRDDLASFLENLPDRAERPET